MFEKVFLDYDFDVFLDADYTQHTGSCVRHQVHELTDIHDKYGGFPETYVMANTIIHQLWWTADQIDFAEIGRQLGMEVITVSSIKQPPGCVIPWHRDTFFQINQRFPNDPRTKVRANMFMEDRKMGHLIEHDLGVCSEWRKGQGFMWDSSVEHLGANVGMEPKYTLQISGFLI